ncbi:HNH endonuclease signature motif containing protein [Streptomyces shenzhenensis]|uniref:HNH endonuclease signature motif containing protein n=1 Tax=Streptomyces shenzhenensis TaxID=943815 RepID=UPI00215DA600|nr:HNH endonuclease signature motif containing protein [Streptomyces shenzhenensis]
MVAISLPSRRILWCRSGGCCAICRSELVIPSKTGKDDPSVVAEEAHIVAQSPQGPRGDANYPGDVDHHENLILLCRIHHKMIDDQVNEWTIGKLRGTKSSHEAWVAERLRATPQRTQLIPDPGVPNPEDVNFDLIISGAQLWNLLNGASSWRFSYSQEGAEEEVDEMVGMLDELSDWADISGDIIGLRRQRETAKRVEEVINRAAEIGYVFYARELALLITGGAYDEPWPWKQVEVHVPRATVLFEQVAEHMKSAPADDGERTPAADQEPQ